MKSRSEYTFYATKLWRDGKTTRQIADEIGINYSTVYSIITHAIKRGELPPRPPQTVKSSNIAHAYNKFGVKVGKVGELVNGMSRDVLEYFAGEVVDGGYSSLCELLSEIMIDEYYRRQEAEK